MEDEERRRSELTSAAGALETTEDDGDHPAAGEDIMAGHLWSPGLGAKAVRAEGEEDEAGDGAGEEGQTAASQSQYWSLTEAIIDPGHGHPGELATEQEQEHDLAQGGEAEQEAPSGRDSGPG